MTNELITRSEARAKGLKHFFTGVPCKHGHVALRYTSVKTCVECGRNYVRQSRLDNPEWWLKKDRTFRAKNPEKTKEACRKWREANRTAASKSSDNWRRKNLARDAARAAKRRANRVQATLPGYDADIAEIYRTCPEGWHVDHIVPLRGKEVCGLHVPWNLQHLPAEVNLSKSNRF